MIQKRYYAAFSRVFVPIFLLANFNPQAVAGKVEEMKQTEALCGKVTGIAQGTAEYIAKRKEVSVFSVRLIRTSWVGGWIGCSAKIDTAQGPIDCFATYLYSDGKEFWLGGICQNL
jgi:hypothetical protein